MTQVTRTELMPGVYLTAVHTMKFKSSYMGIQLLTPLSEEHAAANALVPMVLRQGDRALPGHGEAVRRVGRAVRRLDGAHCPQKRGDPVRGLCGQLPGRCVRPRRYAYSGAGGRSAGGAAAHPRQRERQICLRLCGAGAGQPGGPPSGHRSTTSGSTPCSGWCS